jgi:OOP family OmpA-OmpF porin
VLLWLSGPLMLFLRRLRKRRPTIKRNSGLLLSLALSAVVTTAAPVRASGPFVGLDLGVSEPTDGNYRAHAETGATFNPYVGYMFNQYLGLEGQIQFAFQSVDHHANFPDNPNQTTTLLGGTGGPRFELPFHYPFDLGDGEIYATAQGGYFTGLSGRLSHSAPGFSTGMGIGYKLTPTFTLEVFGRWNTSFMSPRPKDLGPGQVPQERIGDDIEWATGGLGVRYTFPEAPPPPPPTPPVAQLPPVAPLQKKIVLRNVLFDFDRSNIRPDSAPVLDEAVALLKEAGAINIAAEGHTDSIGTEAYNLKLSLRRANSVRQYLIDHGIAADRIRVEGFGESQPVASNATADGRAQNRRVELRVIQ